MAEETVPAAPPEKPDDPTNRRTRERFPCELTLTCRLVRKRFACARIGVIDLSTTGIGSAGR